MEWNEIKWKEEQEEGSGALEEDNTAGILRAQRRRVKTRKRPSDPFLALALYTYTCLYA